MFYFAIFVLLASIGFGVLHATHKGDKKELQKFNIGFSILMAIFAIANLLQVLN